MSRGGSGGAGQTRVAKVILKKLRGIQGRRVDPATGRNVVDVNVTRSGPTVPELNRTYNGPTPRPAGNNAAQSTRNWQPNTDYRVRNVDSGTTVTYRTDSRGRVYEVRTRVNPVPKSQRGRNAEQQSLSGGQDRVVGHTRPDGKLDGERNDAGSHHVADEHGGPREGINYNPENGQLNSNGARRQLEEEWNALAEGGNRVDARQYPMYSGTSERPDAVSIEAVITRPDGTTYTKSWFFRNDQNAPLNSS